MQLILTPKFWRGLMERIRQMYLTFYMWVCTDSARIFKKASVVSIALHREAICWLYSWAKRLCWHWIEVCISPSTSPNIMISIFTASHTHTTHYSDKHWLLLSLVRVKPLPWAVVHSVTFVLTLKKHAKISNKRTHSVFSPVKFLCEKSL